VLVELVGGEGFGARPARPPPRRGVALRLRGRCARSGAGGASFARRLQRRRRRHRRGIASARAQVDLHRLVLGAIGNHLRTRRAFRQRRASVAIAHCQATPSASTAAAALPMPHSAPAEASMRARRPLRGRGGVGRRAQDRRVQRRRRLAARQGAQDARELALLCVQRFHRRPWGIHGSSLRRNLSSA
jgi:hypothetical protein